MWWCVQRIDKKTAIFCLFCVVYKWRYSSFQTTNPVSQKSKLQIFQLYFYKIYPIKLHTNGQFTENTFRLVNRKGVQLKQQNTAEHKTH